MVVIKLECSLGHNFEGWFKSTDEYNRQLNIGMVECPHCGVKMSDDTHKSDTISFDDASFVSSQEIKMISEQFTSDSAFTIKAHLELADKLLDSVQQEVKDFNEDGISSASIQLENLEKDKLN